VPQRGKARIPASAAAWRGAGLGVWRSGGWRRRAGRLGARRELGVRRAGAGSVAARLAALPEPVVEPLVEVGGHVLKALQVAVLEGLGGGRRRGGGGGGARVGAGAEPRWGRARGECPAAAARQAGEAPRPPTLPGAPPPRPRPPLLASSSSNTSSSDSLASSASTWGDRRGVEDVGWAGAGARGCARRARAPRAAIAGRPGPWRRGRARGPPAP
jgi:hypothetical protein